MEVDGQTPAENPPPSTQPKKAIRKRTPKKRGRAKRPLRQRPSFPVADIHKMLARGRGLASVDPQVPLYLAAVEEYVAHEVIELAGNHALNRNSNSIDEEDVMTVIRDDRELNMLLGKALGK